MLHRAVSRQCEHLWRAPPGAHARFLVRIAEFDKMQWTQEKTLLFIDKYRSYPQLWDPTHHDHFNKLKKSDAWVEIADEINENVEECKRKMTSLLASLRREKIKGKKTMGTGKGADEVYTSTWFAYKSLQFVLDRNDPRMTDDTLRDEYASGITQSAEQNREPTPNPPLNDQRCTQKRKRGCNSDEIMTSAFDILKKSAERKQMETLSKDKMDECDSFASFIANKLRSYSRQTRTNVQQNISNIVFSADRGEYEYNIYSNNCQQPTSSFRSNNMSTLSHQAYGSQPTNRSRSHYVSVTSPSTSYVDITSPSPQENNRTNSYPTSPVTPHAEVTSPAPQGNDQESSSVQVYSQEFLEEYADLID